ncbi:MAG: RsmB/NOP family class I SAM-dependent RNA methyltransferase, partial [Odoribacter sp.]|nr:RsmB/NOP family class I SAM-dependent RNA methyltransferase [Odoribacter sp.]
MTKLPTAFTERIQQQLGDKTHLFLEALHQPAPISVRINPNKTVWENLSTLTPLYKNKIKWCKEGYYLNNRPVFTLDPLFHSGAYYVQEASSMFLDYILKQIMPETPVKALDLCAAPGGKSTLLASALPKGSLLVSNEVIKTRASILKENIIKWGHDNIVVTNSDPSRFSNLSGIFDIVLIDAPCSGEGMFRKDEKVISEWSVKNTEICAERQKRIIKDVWNTLKPGGYFIYSTCTYNIGENEEIAEWIKKEYKAEPIKISHSFDEIVSSGNDIYGYRFYPHQTEGEGFFITVFRKTEGNVMTFREEKKKPNKSTIQLPADLTKMLPSLSDYSLYKTENMVGMFPSNYLPFLTELEKNVKVIYKG